MHSSFLLALPLAHLGTARYLPWGKSRATLAPRELPAVQVIPFPMADPAHESMSMSMSMSMTGAHPMGTAAPLVQLASSSSIASAIFISMAPSASVIPLSIAAPPVAPASIAFASVVPASPASVAASASKVASPAVPSASSIAAFSSKASAAAVPSASSAAVGSPKAPSAASSAAAVSAKASSAASSAATVSAKASSAAAAPLSSASAFIPTPAPTAASGSSSGNSSHPPANPAYDTGLSSGLHLNVLTLEAELAASTDLLELAQKGNPMDKIVYNVGKENLRALQGAGVKIRVNNMELAKNNPKILRNLAQLQGEQAREMELSSKLTGDATGDLSVLMQLKSMLSMGIQKHSNYQADISPSAPLATGAATFPGPQPMAAGSEPLDADIQPAPVSSAILSASAAAVPKLSSSGIALPVPALATPAPMAANPDGGEFEEGDPLPKGNVPSASKVTGKAAPTSFTV